MKKTTLAALLIAASITFVSCDWFSSKKKDATPSIVGTWQVDSLSSTGTDSSSLALLLFAMARTNKDSLLVRFNDDSTFIELPVNENKPSKYYVKEKEIFIQEGSTYKPYGLSFKSDSTASLLSKDSILYVLKRK